MAEAAHVSKEDHTGWNASQLNPDPTERTLDQSRREIAMLRELIESKLHGKDEVSSLLKEFNLAIVSHIRLEMSALKELEEEKFKGINGQFSQRDLALTAALQAQKESAAAQQTANTDSIQKSESMTTKQIDALADKIDDIKDRITALEGNRQGSLGATTTGIAIVVAVIILLGVVADIAFHMK
jgi:uncharacterized protein YdcH (DUF465 family)